MFQPMKNPMEFDFQIILSRLRDGWQSIAAFIGLGLIITLIFLHNARTIYRVEMLILPAPADQAVASSQSPTASALGSLLGVSAGQASSDYLRYQHLIYSPATAARMNKRDGMMRYVFSSNWDEKEKRFRPSPPDTRTILLGWLFSLSHIKVDNPPDITSLADYVQAHVIITPSVTTDIVTVRMEDPRPEFAKKVLLSAHNAANDLLRNNVAERARQQVDYLNRKLAETSVADYRATLLALLSQQEKTLMLTQTNASFAAEIVSPPTAYPTPVSPRPVLSVVVAILVSGLIGAAIVIFLGPFWWRHLLPRLRGPRGRHVRTGQHSA